MLEERKVLDYDFVVFLTIGFMVGKLEFCLGFGLDMRGPTLRQWIVAL